MQNRLENSSKNASTQASMSDLQSVRGAQLDMRKAYLDGSPGVLVSGFVWLVSGLIAIFLSPQKALWALVIGGALIHPISVVVTKVLGATDQHSKENPLEVLQCKSRFLC